MIRSALLATASVSLSLVATEASAHGIHQHYAYRHHHYDRAHHGAYRRSHSRYGAGSSYRSNVAAVRSRGLPWCGAEMADELGIHGQQGRELWLARNWARIGTATSAHIGAVVVWPHHVGRIVGQENGQWVVRSGNDGGGVRSRARSLARAIAIRDVGFGGSFTVASTKSFHSHHQRVASVEHRTPLWMYEETTQPDRFGAAAGS